MFLLFCVLLFCCCVIKTSSIGICILYIGISGYIRSSCSSTLLPYPKPTTNHCHTPKPQRYANSQKTHLLNLCYLPKTTQTSTPHSDPTPQLVAASVSYHPPQGPATRQTESPSPGSTSPLPAPLGVEAAAVVAAGAVVAARGCA
jgi:hypothetical protein